MRPEQIERIKKQYPAGTRICCDDMPNDPRPIESGTLGTVRGVDDAGQVMVAWDDGRGLSLIPGVDSFHVVQPDENLTEDITESEGQNIGM
ncbi:MAG: DUF4314 domain-containing protein [Ruminococcus sp.]|nr:DUF4314 domain-containing protein [Ruminococcus sp.]